MGKHRKNPDRPEPEYEVGYQKPPEETKFKPGHKGFPGKRGKKRIDLNGMIADAFLRKIAMPVDVSKMSVIEAAVSKLVLQVANNPAKYMKANMPLIQAAITAREREAGVDEKGVDVTAEFRRRIEQLSQRQRFYREQEALPAPEDNDPE